MPNESTPLQVLLVAARYLPYSGGVEIHVYEVGKRLVREGVNVTILSTDLSGRLPVVEEAEGMQIRRVPAWPTNKDYYFAPSIYHVITHGQWDLVHCHSYHNFVAPIAMLAALQAKIPYILTFHSGGDVSRLRTMLRGMQWRMLRPLLARARKLIAVSKFEADFFREGLRLPGEQFMVIPNGAHLPQATEIVGTGSAQGTGRGQAPSIPTVPVCDGADDGPLIVSVGRLERYKGHQRVIAALPKVLEQIPNVRLLIVGAGSYESTLRELTRKLGVAKSVKIQEVLPGDRCGMASLLVRADLVTLLSEYESQGIAIMEALALQRPVLVAGSSALQEFADQGLARAVSLKSTPEEVANAIIDQLRHPLVPMNVQLPTWDDCAGNLLATYHAVARKMPCVS